MLSSLIIEGNKIMNGFDHTVLEVPIEINTLQLYRHTLQINNC